MLRRLYPLTLCASALIAAFMVIVSHESGFLQFVELQNLFLDTPLFFHQQAAVAGGLLCYVGAWLSEFLYVPWLGALLLCLLCGLLMWLTAVAFRVPERWAPLLLLPLAAILMSCFTLGYWVYVLKLPGFFFVGVVGFSLALLPVLVSRRLAGRSFLFRLLVIVVTGVALYPLAGFYGLLATLLLALGEWRQTGTTTQKTINSLVALLLIVGIPLVCYRYVYDQTNIDYIWRAALPLFEEGELQLPVYYAPYAVLCLFFAVLSLVRFKPGTARKPALQWVCHAVAVAAIVAVCAHFWYTDKNFHDELRIGACVEQNDWQQVAYIVAEAEEPTRLMVLYRYLALFKMGRAGDELYLVPNSDKQPNSPVVVPMVQQGGRPIYLHYGIQNFCFRWCVEDGVENGWSVYSISYMLRCALLSEEWNAAQRYIDLLKHTRYHGQWASAYEPLVGHPERVRKHAELGPVTQVIGKTSVLGSDKSKLENFLLALLANMRADNATAADLVLMSALQLKDIPTYWRAFFQYASLMKDQTMPRYYQEAAYLYSQLEHNVDTSGMPFDQTVVDGYKAFMEAAQQCQGMSEAQMRTALRSRFGQTFYYDYFLQRDLTTY